MLNQAVNLSDSFLPFIHGKHLAIDSGISLSKIVFSFDTENNEQSLRFVSVLNEELKSVLSEICETLGKNAFNKVIVTGLKNLWTKAIVKSIFDIDANVVEEVSLVVDGFQLILNNLKLSDIELKSEANLLDYNKYKIDMNNPIIEKFLKSVRLLSAEETNTNDDIINFPNLLVFAGSTIKCYLMTNDRTAKLISTSMFAGKTMNGLSKCLIDSNNFNENVSMACKGNREKIDTQIKEVMIDIENSPYGKLPPEFPMLSFGKCADYNKDKKCFSSNDLMTSLSFIFLSETNIQITQLCKIHNIKYVYYCGGLFNTPIFSKQLRLEEDLLPQQIKKKIINVNYILALGALKK